LKPVLSALLLSALLAAAPACFAQAAPVAASAHVQATIAMRDPAALEIGYQIPPSCTALSFVNDGIRPNTASALRSDWTPADDCTVVDANGVRPARAACTTLRVRVPATRRFADRVYPWAYPLDHGLYVHTMSYAVTGACGPVDWRFEAPGGTVVADGVASAAHAERGAGAGGDEMPVVMLQEAPSGKRLHMDAGFTPQGLAFLDETVAGADRELHAMLPGLPFSLPYTVASVSSDGNWWGDVANRTIMRLNMPAEPAPGREGQMRGFLTHEMSHLTQPAAGKWNDAWSEDTALIGEGGAEFLRWTLMRRAGWSTPAEQGQDLERAVTGCVVAAAGRSWHDFAERGWNKAPYDCGLAYYAIGLSAGTGAAPPLLRIRDYYRKAKLGERTDFAQALECGDTAGCAPRWLNRLHGDEPIATVLLDHARQRGALLRPATVWSPALVEIVARHYLGGLMQHDCHGAISMFNLPDSVRIAAGPTCGTLREGMVIVRAEGLPLFGEAAGLQASARACAQQGRTVLGLKDGKEVTLACDKSNDLPAQLFSVDLARLPALAK
jgi:hypothetical protein